MGKSILVTGGAGYIGTHICVELIAAGHDAIVVDNLSRSLRGAIDRIAAVAGRPVEFVEADLRDADAMRSLFAERRIDAVIHLAGYKAVGESSSDPLLYYDNNVIGMIALCRAMADASVRTLVYSSSATVYGEPQFLPMAEDHPLSPTSPYGQCKLIGEMMLGDLQRSDPRWRIARLRYFNPVGAHESGMIGEDPRDAPNNLLPFVAQVAIGRRDQLTIFGDDYDTPDGTGVRDYIHVVDLARAHVRAVDTLADHEGLVTLNLGTGRGYSVRELVTAFERASGRTIPYRIAGRRAGDVGACYADPSSATRVLGWQAERDLHAMCADAWRWQSMNPQGYGGG